MNAPFFGRSAQTIRKNTLKNGSDLLTYSVYERLHKLLRLHFYFLSSCFVTKFGFVMGICAIWNMRKLHSTKHLKAQGSVVPWHPYLATISYLNRWNNFAGQTITLKSLNYHFTMFFSYFPNFTFCLWTIHPWNQINFGINFL